MLSSGCSDAAARKLLLFGRLTGLETPYAKFHFATPQAEKQLDLEITRDLDLYRGLVAITKTARIIQYECGYAAVEAKGIEAFKRQPR